MLFSAVCMHAFLCCMYACFSLLYVCMLFSAVCVHAIASFRSYPCTNALCRYVYDRRYPHASALFFESNKSEYILFWRIRMYFNIMSSAGLLVQWGEEGEGFRQEGRCQEGRCQEGGRRWLFDNFMVVKGLIFLGSCPSKLARSQDNLIVSVSWQAHMESPSKPGLVFQLLRLHCLIFRSAAGLTLAPFWIGSGEDDPLPEGWVKKEKVTSPFFPCGKICDRLVSGGLRRQIAVMQLLWFKVGSKNN